MKIDGIFITSIEVNSKWDDKNSEWVKWEEVKFNAYGKSSFGTEVNLQIEATPEERETVFKLMERVTKRIQEEGE